MHKEQELEKLCQEMKENRALPLFGEANLVFGEGNVDCEAMFIGEAPGFYENEAGRPFVGRAGQLLDKLITAIGWRREDVYITNIVKRRPPNNRDPLPEEIAAYKPYLARQISVINPNIIAPLGRFSMNYFLPEAKISRDQGKTFWWSERVVMPIYHPAAALRNPDVLEDMKKSFARLKVLVTKFDKFLEERETKEEAGMADDIQKLAL